MLTPRSPRLAFDIVDLGYLGLARAAGAFVFPSVRGATNGATLIECGPAACRAQVLNHPSLRDQAIRRVLVTHIHLDHAGAAGHLVADGASVFVHPLGARHLIDPTKLIASSRRVHGTAFDVHYGEPLPCQADRVVAVPDGGVVELDERGTNGLLATALDTPGHARHHHTWLVSNGSRCVAFAGDVAAMLIPESQFVSIPMPPPEFDLDAWRRSLARLEASAPDDLVLTHFGAVPNVALHLRTVRRRLDEECELVADLVRSGTDEDAAIERYRAWLWPQAIAAGVSEDRLRPFLGAAFCRMNLQGVRRWLETTPRL
ncbi:MAG: MBL fold metallo-hydrolase [Phycisphaerae bacterium]|nr:MBL fold metallo-hydrolase [Phycisphaerae bacterium]